MTQIISDPLTPCIGVDFADSQQVSLEWIQNLSSEFKDAALLRLCKIVEARTTLVESFALNQVLYRTLTGNTFTESAQSVAARTGHDRKTILKGLNQAVNQNILEENKRPGTSNEYFFKPVEEWLPQPVVLPADIRNNKIIEFPLSPDGTQPEKVGVIHSTDDLEMDANTVVVINKLEKTTSVSVHSESTPKSTYWKYVGQGIPRVYVPPELDSNTGMKIESIHIKTKQPRQFIIKNAVDLLYNQLNQIPSIMELEQKIGTVNTIPDEVLLALTEAGIHLTPCVAERLWLKYSESFVDALAYTVAQDKAGKIKQSKEGFFRKSLAEGWSFTLHQNQERKPVSQVYSQPTTIDQPSPEEMALIDDAIATGRAQNKYYGSFGWLVIENNGHVGSWQQFLTLMEEGQR